MKQNYIDEKGVYHNELNLTLAQIYDSGVEFGCKVTAKGVIEKLEKIKQEIETYRNCLISSALLEKYIAELKGEQ